jgi:hypothetical protein
VILGPDPPPIPAWFTTTMLALNIAVGSAIVFTLLRSSRCSAARR